MATKFIVKMDVSDMQGKNVLVFLKPQPPQRNYRIHAWQILTASAGSTESFNFDTPMSVDVTSIGEKGQKIISQRIPIMPGQLYVADSPASLSPELKEAGASMAQEKLTPNQAGVRNETTPFWQVDVNWYVDDKPVVTCPYVDKNMTCTFEFLPHLYFMVAAPPLIGQTYIIQNFSDMTEYIMPISATEVQVNLTKESGLWKFSFNPQSAPPANAA